MTIALKPYPRMKDSGVEVLGFVPEHWNVKRLGNFGAFSKGNGGNKEDATKSGVPCVRYGDIYTTHKYFIEMSQSFVSPKKAKNYTSIRFGDVLFAGSGETIDEIGKSAVNLIRSEAYCGGDVILFRPRINLSARYFGYASDCAPSAIQKARMGRGITIMHIYGNELKNLTLALPPLLEQTAIARFLYHMDRRIQKFIRAREKLITLLDEYKRALIHQAVTGQIDVRTGEPYPEYKESGVEWIGRTPAHWVVRKLTDVARQETGHTPSRKIHAYWRPDECVIPWVSLADVWKLREGHIFLEDTMEKVSAVGLANSSARLLPENTVVLSRTASVGFSAILAVPMATTQDFAAWVCGPSIRPMFLNFVLGAMGPEFRRRMIGATHQTIYMPDIRAFRTPLPSVGEQDAICQMLNAALERTRQRSQAAARSIQLIRDYRTRLIADVVTGKLDVREAAAGLPDIDSMDDGSSSSPLQINILELDEAPAVA